MKRWPIILLVITFSCGSGVKTVKSQKREKNFYDHPLRFNLDHFIYLSKKQNEPVLLYFTAYGAVNCRKMEDQVFIEPDIDQLLYDEFICIALYVDDYQTKIPNYTPDSSSKELKTIGDENSFVQQYMFKTNHQPYFVVLDENRSILGTTSYCHKREFKAFLKNSADKYRELHPE